MRQPVSRYDMLLKLLGAIAKVLFIGMFMCTVLTVVAALLGAVTPALLLFELVWGWFWRLGLSILATIAVVTMLDGWQ
ncbi:MAG: hypothetical protein WBG38_17685 [Nodosilinea sp.]